MLLLTTVLFLLSAHNSLAALPRRPVYHGPRTPVVDLSTTAPPSNPIPRSPFKQTSREAILARAREKERRKNAKIRGKRQAAAAQASATVYPSCAGMANKAAIQQTGFADLSPWYISRTAPYDVTGSWKGVKTALECIVLCQQVGSSCIGAYYDPTAGTCTQRTSGVPSANMWASLNGGTMAVRGTCSQIAAAVSNATIMAGCCDNLAPSSTVCANAAYQSLGQFCARSQSSLGGNTLSSSTVTGTGRTAYQNCISACTNASSTAYTQQTASAQCLGAVYDSDPPVTTTQNNGGLLGGLGGLLGGGTTTTVGPNCILQGNALSSITTTSDTSVVALISGTCEEQNAGSGTYSAAILAVQGCNTDPQLAFSS